MHKFEIGEELIYKNNGTTIECKILEHYKLIYKTQHPTYKIKLKESLYPEFNMTVIIAPECMLYKSL